MYSKFFKKAAVAATLAATMAVSAFSSGASSLDKVLGSVLPATATKGSSYVSPSSATVNEYASAELKSLDKLFNGEESKVGAALELLQKGTSVKLDTTFTPTKEFLQKSGITNVGKINPTRLVQDAALKNGNQYQEMTLYNGADKTLTAKLWLNNGKAVVQVPELTSKYIKADQFPITTSADGLKILSAGLPTIKKLAESTGKKYLSYAKNITKNQNVDVKVSGLTVKADSYTFRLSEQAVREILYYTLGNVKADKTLVANLGLTEQAIVNEQNKLKAGKVFNFSNVELVAYVADGEIIARKINFLGTGGGITSQVLLSSISTSDGKYAQSLSYRVASQGQLKDVIAASNSGEEKNGAKAGKAKLSFGGQALATLSYTGYKEVKLAKLGTGATGSFTLNIPSSKLTLTGTLAANAGAQSQTIKATASEGKVKLFDLSLSAVASSFAQAASPKLTNDNSLTASSISQKDRVAINANLLKIKATYAKTDVNDFVGYELIHSEAAKATAPAALG
jgi:hypothetical protein